MYLHQERAPAAFDENRRSGPLCDLHAALGVDVDLDEYMAIEHLLVRRYRTRRVAVVTCAGQRRAVGLRQRRAEVVERLDEP